VNNDNTVFSALEDAVSALVAEKHGPDCVVGSWVLVAESIAPEDGVRTRHVCALSEEVRR